MRELGRILSARRLAIGLLLLLLANGFLFAREQREKGYGLDLELPAGGYGYAVFDGSFGLTPETVDGAAAYGRYLERLDRVRDMPLPDAAARLTEEKEALEEKIGAETATDSEKLDYPAAERLLAQIGYLTGYGDWLDGIQRNREELLTFSIFNDPDSFSGRNIIKTAEEFKKLEGVELSLGADGAVEALLTFRLTDYFLLAALLLFVLAFLEERKAGLWSVVHAAPSGRLRLAVRRTLILLGASAGGVALLYGTDLAIGFALYGGAEGLDRAAQSVEALGRLPALWTVGGFLARFLLLRTAAAFFVGLLLWLLLSAVDNVKYTIVVAAGVLAAEYGLYTFLPVQSAFNVLKYFNLFTYISLSDLYANYLNIDLLGFPLGIRSISQAALVPLCLLTAAACIAVHCRKKPAAGRDLLGRAAYGINRATDKFLRRLGLLGMELHKTLWIQKGVVIAALLIYVAAGLNYTVNIPVTSAEEQAARAYTAEFAGEITDDTFARMDEARAELDAKAAAYEEAKAAYERGEMDFSHLNVYEREASAAERNGKGLAAVRARAEELRARGAEEGFAPWLVDDTPFESVYGLPAQGSQHRAAAAAALALTLLLAGSMAYERQSGMTFLLKSTARGRGALLIRKLLLAALTTALVWSAVYRMELYALLSEFSVTAWAAPVQNLSMLAEFPVHFPVAGWLAFLYIWRWLALLCGGVVVLLISSRARRAEAACVAGCLVMLLPSLLYAYLGVEAFRPLAYLLPVEAAPLLAAENGAVTGLLPYGAALIGLAGAAAGWLALSTGGARSGGSSSFGGRRGSA